MEDAIRLIVEPEEDGERLDRFLSGRLSKTSRSQIRRHILEGHVLVGDEVSASRPMSKAKPSRQMRAGECVWYEPPEPEPAKPEPEAIALKVVYEDECMLVVDKPPAMVVHPSPGHSSGTLVNALLHHCENLSGVGGVKRPGIVHRLDKDTSGLMVVSKTDECHWGLSRQFKKHSIERRYLTVVAGRLDPPAGKLETGHRRHRVDRKRFTTRVEPPSPGGGGGRSSVRLAVTHYRTVEQLRAASLVEARLETGRTHQVRVHFADRGHPVVGDPVYGRKTRDAKVSAAGKQLGRQALHAAVLGLTHPLSGERKVWISGLPDDMVALVERLGGSWPIEGWPPPIESGEETGSAGL